MKFKTSYQFPAILMLLILSVLFSGCLKQLPENNGEKLLRIEFNSQTINLETIDSAFLNLTAYGTNQLVNKKLQKNVSSYTLDLSTLSSAVYYGEIVLYLKKDSADRRYQHYVPLNFNIDVVSAINLPGPIPNASPLWRRRIILEDENHDLEAFIPLDVSDPYFEIRSKMKRWDSVQITRTAYRKVGADNQVVKTQSWSCTGDCFPENSTIIKNAQGFTDFANYMKTMIWDNASTKVIVRDNVTDEDIELSFSWEK